MNNYNFTQALDGLNNIEADNVNTSNLNVGSLIVDTAEITTLSDCNLVNCTAETPLNNTSVVNKTYVDSNFLDRTNNLTQNVNGEKTFTNNLISNSQTTFNNLTPICSVANPTAVNHLTRKDYVDSNFVDRTNNLTQNVNGLKTFSNNTNFTGSLLSRTNIKLSEYENTASTNTITLAFPMSETIALRTTPATSNPMTINLPLLTNNERGYVFTFNKLFDTANATNRNFPVAFNTSGGQGIYTLYDQFGTPTSNTTLLSVEKIQCKLAVGWYDNLLYWIEQTDFSTYDRYKLTEWGNATTTNTLTLTLPLPPTIALRTSTVSTMTITLPTLTTLERGKIFTFVKVNSYNYDVIFNTSSGQAIYPINNLSGTPTTNTTIFPSNKKITRLAVGWFGGSTYWIEVSDYSTFDIDQNNLLYARLASPNAFTNTNTFNSFLPTSTLTPSSNTQLITKIYADTNFLDRANNLTQNVNGLKTFTDDLTAPNIYCNTALYFRDINLGLNKALIFHQADIVYFDTLTVFDNYWKFKCFNIEQVVISQLSSTFNNKLISLAQARFENFTPTCTVSIPTQINHLTRKDYVDNNFVDFTTDQTITGTKRFNSFFCTSLNITPTSGGGGNRQQIYMSGNYLTFMPQFNNNVYTFHCKDSVPNLTTPLTIDSGTTTIANNLASNAITYVKEIRWRDQGAGTEQQSYLSGTEFHFVALFNSNTYRFYCRDSGSAQTYPLTINSANTTIANNLVTNNLTSPTATSTNNIYTTLSSGGIVNFGSSESTCNFNSDTTFVGNIFSETAIYFKDIGIGSQLNQARIFKQDDYLYFDTNINYTNGYSFRHSSNDTLTITSSSTNIENNLISNSQATFNNSTPICSVSSPTANNHLTRKDYVDNNFVDKTNTQTDIAGDKTFTGRLYNTFVIFAKDLSWLDAQGSGGRVQAYLSATDLGFISVNVNNNRYLFNTKDGAGNPSTPLLISSASTTISNNLVSNNLTSPTTTSTNNIYTSLVSGGAINIGGSLGTNNIYGSTTFNSSANFNVGVSFLGISSFNNGGTFSEIEQTSGSNLVIRNTTNSKKIILSTTSASTGQVDSLAITTSSCDILSPTLNLNSSSTINILTPNNLTGVINFLSTLTTATINFCSTTYTSVLYLNARLLHKQVQYMNEVKTISGTSLALAFPLEQTWMFTATGATQITITLPELTASRQAGYNFFYFKTASVTNSVLFTRSGTNTIRGLNSITDLTSITKISGTNTVGQGFYTAEVSTGNFAWISY